jgi:hypothetical protein
MSGFRDSKFSICTAAVFAVLAVSIPAVFIGAGRCRLACLDVEIWVGTLGEPSDLFSGVFIARVGRSWL